ncbi:MULTISPECIES: hypothetical protein [unclassified Streptomyces]|uniref:hypothetical protein n=1 Tax=unclassified Streptomyces TaxID=2593676 RepID=UPI003800C4A1
MPALHRRRAIEFKKFLIRVDKEYPPGSRCTSSATTTPPTTPLDASRGALEILLPREHDAARNTVSYRCSEGRRVVLAADRPAS